MANLDHCLSKEFIVKEQFKELIIQYLYPMINCIGLFIIHYQTILSTFVLSIYVHWRLYRRMSTKFITTTSKIDDKGVQIRFICNSGTCPSYMGIQIS